MLTMMPDDGENNNINDDEDVNDDSPDYHVFFILNHTGHRAVEICLLRADIV